MYTAWIALLLLLQTQDPTPAYNPNSERDPNDLHKRGSMDTPANMILVRGRVATSGGGALPGPASVEGFCGGVPQQAVFTQGDFDLALAKSGSTNPINGGGNGGPCQIRVSLAGFRSVVVPVQSSGSSRAEVGLIILKPRDGVTGFTYSATTLFAPPNARKAFQKGFALAGKNKFKEARKELETATGLFPKFAAAWCELGDVLNRMSLPAEARTAYQKAFEADAKFLRPMLHLAMLEAGQRQWKASAMLTDRVIAQNPHDYPEAFLYNAAALYNLGLREPAEQAVMRAIELDTGHVFPKSYQLLATIQTSRGDRKRAAENLRLYLQHAANHAEAEQVRRQLAELEKLPVQPVRN